MNNSEIKDLCLALLNADTEEAVIDLLKQVGYWDDPNAWRLYGDKAGNFSQAGNQAAKPEAALVEKIVNSVDSRLMNECAIRGIDPESAEAPQSIREAVARFYEEQEITNADQGGTLCNWTAAKRTEQSRFVTVAATGGKPTQGKRRQHMCITIADQGEGQSPDRLPRTILSLNESNKQCIRFVQGKFNMGGSGALRFCGTQGLQLVISRRNPALACKEKGEDPSADQWGVTIVRRERPSDKSGDPVHSEFTYLAPIGSGTSPNKGNILRFSADSLPLMPKHDDAYEKEVEWATVIKLYEYETTVGQSNILMKDGLLFALERLLPEIGLPVRLHECRGYKGVKERSFETALSGLIVRLEEGKGDNLESNFPLSVHLEPVGMRMHARIYAFKEDKASTYIKDEGVIFTINGQAHGHLPRSIFSRPKAVGLPRLRESLLVLLDCSELGIIEREDLFMTSRDRLSKKPIRYTVEREVEEMLRHNSVLKDLQQKRKESDLDSKLSEEKPLEEVLGKVLKASPTLKTLFLQGQRLSRAFRGGAGSGNDGNGADKDKDFEGKRHPTFFKVANRDYGKLYVRNCEKDRRCRIKFETDVENGYFDRPTDRGRFELEVIESDEELSPLSFGFSLENGEAQLNMALPSEVQVHGHIVVQASVFDSTNSDPFVNVIELNVQPKQDRQGGASSKKTKKKGGGGGEGDKANQGGIALPIIELVHENDDHWKKYHFDINTACHVITDPVEVDGKELFEHTFYINMDNNSLRTEMKHSKQDPRLLEAKFKYGNVLLGLAMLHDSENKHKTNGNGVSHSDDDDDKEEENVQDRIRKYSGAISPVLLPMIDQLGGLNESDLEMFGDLGDDE